MKRILTVIGVGLATGLIAAGGLVACGSGAKGPGVATANGGNNASATPQPSTSVDREQQMINFARCMRAHGVNVPDPDPNGGPGIRIQIPQGTSKQQAEAAQQACRQYLPNGGNPPSLSPQQLEQVRKFAKCMRDHGVNVPDPDPANPGIRLNNINPNDQTFKAAQQACQSLLPGKGGPGPTQAVK